MFGPERLLSCQAKVSRFGKPPQTPMPHLGYCVWLSLKITSFPGYQRSKAVMIGVRGAEFRAFGRITSAPVRLVDYMDHDSMPSSNLDR